MPPAVRSAPRRRTPRWRVLMSLSARIACLLVAVLALAILPPPALADAPARIVTSRAGFQQAPDVITARLGISPGDDNQGLALGSDRRVLEKALPELFETATSLG